MGQPEGRIADVGLLVLQPEDRAAHLAQQGGAVDLLVELFGLELLHRPGQRTQRGQVLPVGLASKLPSRPSWATSPAALAAAGSKWYLRSQVGPAEIVDSALASRPAGFFASAQTTVRCIRYRWRAGSGFALSIAGRRGPCGHLRMVAQRHASAEAVDHHAIAQQRAVQLHPAQPGVPAHDRVAQPAAGDPGARLPERRWGRSRSARWSPHPRCRPDRGW